MELFLDTITQIQLLNVLLSAMAMTLISALWFSPKLFGNHIPPHSTHKPSHPQRLAGFMVYLATSFLIGLLFLLTAGNLPTFNPSLFVVWLFIALHMLSPVIWDSMPLKTYISCVLNRFFHFLAAALIFSFNG